MPDKNISQLSRKGQENLKMAPALMVSHPLFEKLDPKAQVDFLMKHPSSDDQKRLNDNLQQMKYGDLLKILNNSSTNTPGFNNLMAKIENLKGRNETQVAEDVMRLLLKVIHHKSCGDLNETIVKELIEPHMQTIEKHRGFFKILMDWLRNMCNAIPSLNKYGLFKTKTEKLVHQYVEEIKKSAASP